jgi:histidine triad (HIT) family protein
MDCIFCRIIAGEIPSDVVYQDGDFFAFRDVNPQAPVHILLVPRKHILSIVDVTADDAELLGRMLITATKVAEKVGLAETGYRFAFNYGADANLVVPHLHLHIVGGRKLDDMLG